MAADVEIGAARVHLVVDAAEYDANIARALNSARGFGSDAEKAFDQASKGSRRAATNLLDYIDGLGRASTEQTRFMALLRKAAREGTDPSILKAGLDGWNKYARGIEVAAEQARKMGMAQEEALRINAALDQQRATNAQANYAALLGVGDIDGAEQARRRASAEAALLPLLQQQERQYESMLATANQINAAWDENRTKLAQQSFNSQLGVGDIDLAEQARRRASAEEALLPILEQQERQYESMLATANQINAALDQQRQQNAQDAINRQLGVQTGPRDAGYLAEQRAAVGRLEAAYQQLGAAEAEAHKYNAAADRQIQQLKNLEQTAGKTWYELQKLRNAQLGISKVADPLVDKVRAQNEAMGRGTLTTKQYEFAMRGVPAQITDITTSLIAGQPAYLVLLQQGGQLKDMFGGIKPAAAALGKTLLAFINPATLTAAVLAGLAFAAFKAEERMTSFVQSAIRSGNFDGTAQQFRDIADSLSAIDGVSLSNADAAVNRLAGGGLVADNNFRMAAEASARWASATGDSVDDVAAKFEQIAADPLKALLKFNEAEHFLTQAQLDRVQALVQLGDTQGAVTEATKIYYNVVSERSTQAEASIGNMKSAWRDLKDEIGDAGQAVGRYAEFLASAAKEAQKKPWWQSAGVVGGFTTAVKALYNAAPAGFEEAGRKAVAPTPLGTAKAATDAKALTKAQTDAQEALQKAWEASGSKAEKYSLAVRKLNASLHDATDAALAEKNIQRDSNGNFSGAGYDRLLKTLQDKNKEGKTKLPSGRDATQAIKDQMKAELAAMATQTQQIQAQYQLRDISAADYYSKLRSLAEQERDVTLRGNDAQIAALAGKKDAERQISTLRAASAAANEKYTQRTIELNTQEAQSTRQRELALRDYVNTLKESNDGVQRQMDAMVARVGMGDREYQQLQARNQIYQQQADRLREIQRLVDEYPNSADVAADADKRRQEVMKSTQDALQKVSDGYTNLAEAEASWANGANAAWQNWVTQVQNSAAQAQEFYGSLFDGMGEAAADAFMGIDGSFGSLIDSMYRKALILLANKAIMAIIGGGTDTSAGSKGSTAASIFDGLFGSGDSFFAQGGVPGGKGLSAYRNQIVSSPTFFPFARGGVPNVGLMGEVRAHSEGIFPLAKTANGDLGVRVVESKSNQRPVSLQQTFVIPGIYTRETRDQAAKKMARETSRVLNKG